jgi:hypothetical protein
VIEIEVKTMEDEYSDEYLDESGEESSGCRQCEWYQQKIYELNARLRANLTADEYQAAKEQLDDLIQAQLKHQREHA